MTGGPPYNRWKSVTSVENKKTEVDGPLHLGGFITKMRVFLLETNIGEEHLLCYYEDLISGNMEAVQELVHRGGELIEEQHCD